MARKSVKKQAKLKLDDILVDCYDISEECMAFECYFEDSFKFPFEGKFVKPARGKQKLIVEKIVSSGCGEVLVWIRLPDGARLRTPLCDVEPVVPDKKWNEAMALYCEWL